MTDEELRDLIGELRAAGTDHADVEAKTAETELPKRLWETVSAFANTLGGGVILLGIDERCAFQVVGISNAKKLQQDLASVCDQMEPPIRAQIRLHRFEGKAIVVAEIPETDRSQKPCYYRGAGQTNGRSCASQTAIEG